MDDSCHNDHNLASTFSNVEGGESEDGQETSVLSVERDLGN